MNSKWREVVQGTTLLSLYNKRAILTDTFDAMALFAYALPAKTDPRHTEADKDLSMSACWHVEEESRSLCLLCLLSILPRLLPALSLRAYLPNACLRGDNLWQNLSQSSPSLENRLFSIPPCLQRGRNMETFCLSLGLPRELLSRRVRQASQFCSMV